MDRKKKLTHRELKKKQGQGGKNPSHEKKETVGVPECLGKKGQHAKQLNVLKIIISRKRDKQ